jgi:hypothetical protein
MGSTSVGTYRRQGGLRSLTLRARFDFRFRVSRRAGCTPIGPYPTLFMIAYAAIADSLLRPACMRLPLRLQANGLAAQVRPPHRLSGAHKRGALYSSRRAPLSVLFQVRLGPSRLRAPVLPRDCAISRQTVMNNAG